MILLPRNRAAWIAASAAILGSAVPASAETYLTESQALAAIFGEGSIPRREDRVLDATSRARLEHNTNLKFPEPRYTFFCSGQPQRYAIVMNEIGKSEPITFMVGITDQGKISDVVIMVFRENRGWEVKEKRFLNQFRGKTVRNPIRVEEDIINYTGATLSSKAVARGVKRALALVNAFYVTDNRPAASSVVPANATFAKSEPLAPLVPVVVAEDRTALFRHARYAMGTVCEICLWCNSAREAQVAFRAAFAEIERLEQIFSAWREDSELSLVNREAARQSVPVGAEFFELTRYAVRSWKESGGASDITIGPLVNAWGFRGDEPHEPSPNELAAARALVGCDKLHLDSRHRTIHFERAGMNLDFGGLAKGYSAQRVAQVLHSHGAHAALVNLGRSSLSTSVSTLVDPENRIAHATNVPLGHWLVAIASPTDSESMPAYILLGPSENLSTSGTSERQFQCNGRTLSHILDPRTGEPFTGQRSVTAIAGSGARAEVLAKQLLLDAASSPVPRRGSTPTNEEWFAMHQSENGKLAVDAHFLRPYFTDRT